MTAPWTGRRLHFVGIGGAGMSGLALVAAKLGATVTGTDRAESDYLPPLRALGLQPVIGEHAAAHVPEGAEVVYSTAVPPDNPERAVAERELHRADLLAELTHLKRTIAISGTHGKTTTTSMAVHILHACGLRPSYLVGGTLRATGLNADWDEGEWLVVEADESDRSLLKLGRDVALVTNAELDHHATYATQDDVDATFAEFLAAAEHPVVWDRPALRALAGPDLVAYDAADAASGPDGTRFTWRGHPVHLAVPGIHNAVNAAGALEAARTAGAAEAEAAASLAGFRGAARRFDPLGTSPEGALVYDDYAHHPTEVAATIAAARSLEPRRVVAVFQPHLFSRTQALARDFGRALAGADVAVVVGIYPARERAEDHPGVTGALVARAAAAAADGRTVAWLPHFHTAERWLHDTLAPGDLCLVMGAGNVDRLGRALVDGSP
jgi:UDP-N-acetylmuramate--alanine ligase